MSATPSFPSPRVPANELNAFGGIWRLNTRRFFSARHWLTTLGMLALLVLFSIPAAENAVEAETGFLPWAAGFYVCFLVPILAFISGAGAIRDDLSPATIDYVFTRPVRRPVYVLLRYLSQMAVTQIDFLLALGVVAGIGIFWGIPDLVSALPLLLLGQFAAIVAFTGLGFLCGMLTSRYVIVGLLYGGIVEVGLGNVPTQINQISLVRYLLSIVEPLLGEGGWAMNQAANSIELSLPAIVAILFGVAIVAVALAAGVFSLRQFSGAAGRDN